jgi:hypothetical protein
LNSGGHDNENESYTFRHQLTNRRWKPHVVVTMQKEMEELGVNITELQCLARVLIDMNDKVVLRIGTWSSGLKQFDVSPPPSVQIQSTLGSSGAS